LPKLSRYERRSLLRFLALYLGSVFVLLAIIGWLFFEHNASMMKSAMKFEMLSEAHRIESRLTRALMQEPPADRDDLVSLLRSIKSSRFKVGFFDAKKRPIYSEINGMPGFEQPFYLGVRNCYSMINCPLTKEGVAYIGLEESRLKGMIRALRLNIIGYLLLSFIFMSLVGIILARLFMRPIREKIEALDRFIEETTHELNTPISAILMTIQRLKGVEEKKLERLRASAKRLSTMYDTLSYGLERESDKRLESIDLEIFVAERIAEMEPIAHSRRLQIISTLEPCRIRIHREDLRRLLDNLLSNALKYSDPGGEVSVALQGCRLTITDEGIGMEPETLQRVLKRYERGNRERGGFGIGLSIVTQICNEYGIGFILESQKSKGTVARLDFGSLHR